MGIMTREGYCTRVMYGIRTHVTHTRTYVYNIRMYVYSIYVYASYAVRFFLEKHPSGSLARRVSLQKITRSTGVEWRKMGKIAGSLLYKVNNNTINTRARMLQWRTSGQTRSHVYV